ncbi:MAG: ABC transporter permease [Pirellulales bacterium]|nr:ABC transporter permease [Pirellulales bacterium]
MGVSSTITVTQTLPRDATALSSRGMAWSAVQSLAWREWARFIRQPNRVVGAIGQPILFWILFGAGLGPSFRLATTQGEISTLNPPTNAIPALSYAEYYFPGTLALILLFTAIFATISIIEDRREGFLQGVLVSPAPRWAMVLGKLLGGTAIAVAQAGLFVLLAAVAAWLNWPGVPRLDLLTMTAIFAVLAILGLALTALGFSLAWQIDSTQGYHAVMSLVLLPMWLLSGAFFPPANNWIGWVAAFNPLTYGVALLRRVLYLTADSATQAAALPAELPSWGMSVAVTGGFLAGTLALAWWSAGRRTAGDLL